MAKQFKAAFLAVIPVILLLPASLLAAEQPKPAPAAPIPTQILAAKKVFVAKLQTVTHTGACDKIKVSHVRSHVYPR